MKTLLKKFNLGVDANADANTTANADTTRSSIPLVLSTLLSCGKYGKFQLCVANCSSWNCESLLLSEELTGYIVSDI